MPGSSRPSFFDADFDDPAVEPDAQRAGARPSISSAGEVSRRRRRLRVIVGVAGMGLLATLIVPLTNASADPTPNDWLRLRTCESSNNYSTNTGNGYYGAYQFDLSTWRSVGGSGYPNQAPPAEQDARALQLYRMRGWQPWTCARILGLQSDSDAGSGRSIAIPAPAPAAPATATATATPVAAGSAPAWPGPQYFSFGDQHATIKQFQDQMHARGFFPVGTGDFGPNTLAMLDRLQRQNGLRVTGLLGPVTWKLAWTGVYNPNA